VRKVLNGEPITMTGEGKQYRKFGYVEDLAQGNVLAMNDIAKNKTYNLEGNDKITIKEIAQTIQEILGKGEIKYIEGRCGDFEGNEISFAKAKEELGWQAKTTFRQGLEKYIQWYQNSLVAKT
ncbi:GDP-mannose 4,6-dehydratase, partial [PVC group bacterium]|nr:GDP-mannose 4,6-dehydratase [PVC group bacterium]